MAPFRLGIDRGFISCFGAFRPEFSSTVVVLRPISRDWWSFSPVGAVLAADLRRVPSSSRNDYGIVRVLPRQGPIAAGLPGEFLAARRSRPIQQRPDFGLRADNSDVGVTLSPEPSTMVFLGGGMIVLGLARQKASWQTDARDES
jgi:hypothetical protein